MIKIRDFADSSIIYPYTPKKETYCITHVYDGTDRLSFEISPEEDIYQHIQNETVIEAENNLYLVKNIDDRSGVVYVDCMIDLDKWKAAVFESYRQTNTRLEDAIAGIRPAGWLVDYTNVSSATRAKRTTIEEMEDTPMRAVTPLEILAKIAEVYGVTYMFDVKNLKLTVLEPEYYSGLATSEPDKYFSDELNLRALGYTGNSDEFATRLYAYGAIDENGDPLTFEDINDGKAYVEDKTYCNKTVCIGWSDERYSVKENLLEAARERLAQICNPVRSYQCDVINLNDDMWLFRAVYIIDRKRQVKVKHICVEYQEYPDAHNLDVCTLATVAPDVNDKFNQYLSAAIQKNQQVTAATDNKIQYAENAMEISLIEATQLITGNGGGYKVDILDANNKPVETLYMDTDDMATARNVLRINRSGIGFSTNGVNGPFKTAWTINGTFDCAQINVINLNASNITTGTLSGAEINIGNGKFTVNSAGRVDAANLHISGGDIQIESDSQSRNIIKLSHTNHSVSMAPEKVAVDSPVGNDAYNVELNAGTVRLKINNILRALLHPSNGLTLYDANGTARMELIPGSASNINSISFKDASGRRRMFLSETAGLIFYDANGNITKTYPAT